MPPSSPLLTLHSAGAPAIGLTCANTPIRLKLGNVSVMEPSDPENTHPNSDTTSSLMSSEGSTQSIVVTTQVAPFLEMEEEDEIDEDYDSSEPENANIEKDDNLLLPAAAVDSCEEEKKEEECPNLPARFSTSALPPRVIGISCGKRPRNSRRVTFASDARWPTTDSAHPRRYGKTSLIHICETIHLLDYTPEERHSTWYTLADLRSFKRERKETARQIDNGLIPLRQYADQADHCDIYVDNMSFSMPVEYCSRGAENCTEAMSRVRYRHICDGWRTVLNTQEKHHYQRQRMSSMSASERNEYNALASLLGVGRNKASRTATWFPYGNTSPKTSPHSSPTSDPFANMCCPYDLAAAYLPSSEASLQIARNRAIGDECDAMSLREQDAKAAANEDRTATSTAPSVDTNLDSSTSPNDAFDANNNCNASNENAVLLEGTARTMDV
eukprot:CAMPEP_0116122272 /NCGR_PEP_ID=MMETSP0329-20121206/4127_1 /TAXON_ID=697910 /ORGANISM="Pseudo-nitzschia arenysensis, Strain B593" /LENGTH=442 /DNA_ID=CAMNT_0003616111 /DNA_START=140 /DNA_END=1468 /DNA_ORIENTATION=-